MEIVSVDGKSLNTLTHAQAVDLFRKSFIDKSTKRMELVVMK